MNYLISAAVLIALLVGLVLGINKWESRIEQRGYDRAVAEYNQKAVVAERAQRTEEARRATEQRKALDEQAKQTEIARADAAESKRAANSVRATLAKLRSERVASSDPRITAERATADKVSNLFSVCSARYEMLGRDADSARSAGQLCERLYDSNRPSVRDQVTELRKGKLP